MANYITRTEYLSFAAEGGASAVPLNTPAWECLSYAPLYDSPPVVGQDIAIPGTAGRIAVARQEDEMEVSLQMRFFGARDHENNTHANPRVGLRTNLRYFRTHLMRAASGTTRTATFHRLDGGSSSLEVIVVPPLLVATRSPTLASAVLRLVIPSGVF